MNPVILPAGQLPQETIKAFRWQDNLVHRHLDWLSLEERLTQPLAFACTRDGVLRALLSAAADSPQAAWLRLFECGRGYPHAQAFSSLLQAALASLQEQEVPTLYSLAFSDWFKDLLLGNGFQETDQVISLQLTSPQAAFPVLPEGFTLHQTRRVDLPEVLALDQVSFTPEWRLSARTLEMIYQNQHYGTVMTDGSRVIAYQSSSANFQGMHLNRLAVHPEYQGRGLGAIILQDLIAQAQAWSTAALSVNTQRENHASRKLYARLGFQPSGKPVPVFELGVIH